MRAWIQAARPLAQGNIAPALVLGQALAYAVTGRFSWAMAVGIHLFGILDHLFIIFGNDYADRDADPLIETHNVFSGGSRVLVEGKLEPAAVGGAAVVCAAGLLALTVGAALVGDRPLAPAFALAAIALLWAYSYPPVRLSFRGGGEVLQGLGVGVVLPLVGFYGQAGTLELPLVTLLPTFVLAVAGNVLTALPDEPGDRRADKRTFAVARGARAARLMVIVLTTSALIVLPLVTPPIPRTALAFVVGLPALLLLGAVTLAGSADAARRRRCLAFVVLCGGAATLTQVLWAIALALSAQSP